LFYIWWRIHIGVFFWDWLFWLGWPWGFSGKVVRFGGLDIGRWKVPKDWKDRDERHVWMTNTNGGKGYVEDCLDGNRKLDGIGWEGDGRVAYLNFLLVMAGSLIVRRCRNRVDILIAIESL
jgi:hypothetical protein